MGRNTKLIVLLAILFSNGTLSIMAQANGTDSLEQDKETFEVVEQQPLFPGGFENLKKWLVQNLKYPRTAQEKGIQGRVITQFLVCRDGRIDSVKVLKSVEKSLDAEALRVVKSMPKWQPGTQRGKKVRVRFTLPITFRLAGGGGKVTASKDRDGFDKYVAGLINTDKQNLSLSIYNHLKNKSEALEKAVSMKVFGTSERIESAFNTYCDKFQACNAATAQLQRFIYIKEYFSDEDQVVGVEYNVLDANDASNVSNAKYMIFDCKEGRAITLADLVQPKLEAYLKQQGIIAADADNIKFSQSGFNVVTSKTSITIDVEKLRANLSDFALKLFGEYQRTKL